MDRINSPGNSAYHNHKHPKERKNWLKQKVIYVKKQVQPITAFGDKNSCVEEDCGLTVQRIEELEKENTELKARVAELEKEVEKLEKTPLQKIIML